MNGKILLKQSCFNRKNPRKNCAWSKVFLSHFHKVLPKQMCFSQYLICARINSTKTLSFGRKKNSKNCAWLKVCLSLFYKVLLKQMCFNQYFNMQHVQHCLSNKVFLCLIKIFHFFIKFYWNKCVSVNILICAWKNSTKTKLFW